MQSIRILCSSNFQWAADLGLAVKHHWL